VNGRAQSVGRRPGHVRQARQRAGANPATKNHQDVQGRGRATKNLRAKSLRGARGLRNGPATKSRPESRVPDPELENRAGPGLGPTTGGLTGRGPTIENRTGRDRGPETEKVAGLVRDRPTADADRDLGAEAADAATAFRRTRADDRRAKSRPSPEIESDDGSVRGLDVDVELCRLCRKADVIFFRI